ncbi:MAG: hypothetical protein WBA28_00455 [Microbacteriaceae bacterium]
MSKKLPNTDTDATLQWQTRARELFDQGMGCNQIAEAVGVNPSTVSRWGKVEGLSFDRSQTAMAVRAREIDLAESRTLLAQKMLTAAHDLLDSLDDQFLVYSFGGRDNVYSEHTLDRPPVEAQRQIMTTAGIAFDKASKILEKNKPGSESVAGVLGALAAGFAQAAEDLDNEFNDSPTAE